MINSSLAIKTFFCFLLSIITIHSQLESKVPAPTKTKKTVIKTNVCEFDTAMFYPEEPKCYIGESVILLKPDSLQGRQVLVLEFTDSLIEEKYDSYRQIYLVSKDVQNGLIYRTYAYPKGLFSFWVPPNLFVRSITLDYYKKKFENKIFYALESVNYYSFYKSDDKIIDPFTGDLFLIKRTDLLEFTKLMILDSAKSEPEVVAIFKVGKQHAAMFLSQFASNAYNGLDMDKFLDKSYGDQLKKKYGNNLWQAMMDEKIQIGMPPEMVRIAWGDPDRINESMSASGYQKQWVYGHKYVYFKNGKCTGWN